MSGFKVISQGPLKPSPVSGSKECPFGLHKKEFSHFLFIQYDTRVMNRDERAHHAQLPYSVVVTSQRLLIGHD